MRMGSSHFYHFESIPEFKIEEEWLTISDGRADLTIGIPEHIRIGEILQAMKDIKVIKTTERKVND